MAEKSVIPLFDETSAWLLESQTPSIRYLTLTRLLGKPEMDDEVTKARRLISTTKPVNGILSKQDPEGWWKYKTHPYTPKYRSSHWSMLLLTELTADPQHPGMQAGAEFMLVNIPHYFDEKITGFCCFWGNWLRYELYCGKLDHERVQQTIEILRADLLRRSQCTWNNDLPCAWGVIRDLYGLALIPEENRSTELKAAIQTGIHFLLDEYDLVSANYPYEAKIHPVWSRINYPLFYQSDILFTLRVLKDFGALGHPNAQKAIDWLMGKRTRAGIWRGSSPFGKRTWPYTAEPDGVERWITLHALDVLS